MDNKTNDVSAWSRAWTNYCDTFERVLPPPSEIGGGEGEGATEMGLSRIPALVIYAPLFYLLFWTFFLLLYPMMLVVALFQK